MHLLRMVAGSIGVIFIVLLAKVHAVLSGLLSVFPLIGTANLIALWLAWGETFTLGTVGPLIVGNLSYPVFAYSYSVLLPALGLVRGAVASVVLAVALVSVPAALFIQWLNRTTPPAAGERVPTGTILGGDGGSCSGSEGCGGRTLLEETSPLLRPPFVSNPQDVRSSSKQPLTTYVE